MLKTVVFILTDIQTHHFLATIKNFIHSVKTAKTIGPHLKLPFKKKRQIMLKESSSSYLLGNKK